MPGFKQDAGGVSHRRPTSCCVKHPFFVVGPTAVGKTALAIELAEKFDAEIVNADAFQVYCGLDVLTAKPDPQAQRRVRHHLLGQISAAETMSAAKFRELACGALADIRLRKTSAIVVGGSGLYLQAITQGFDEVPPPDPKLREELSRMNLQKLREKLISLDPETADKIDLKNRRRLIRAVEICLLTGKPASKQRTHQRPVESGLSYLEGGAPATPPAAGSQELAPP